MKYNELTKNELLKIATENSIVGRHDMTKEELIKAVEFITKDGETLIDAETLKDMKRRRLSDNARDSNGNIIRQGKNLSGNSPFRKKFYYLDKNFADLNKVSDIYKEALDAAPNQVKLILRYMREDQITSTDNALQGITIVENAKNMRILQSKIPSANLFAYYRRILEALGVKEA